MSYHYENPHITGSVIGASAVVTGKKSITSVGDFPVKSSVSHYWHNKFAQSNIFI